MSKQMLLTLGLTAALIAGAAPVLAQEGPKPPPPHGASVRVDFGAGRKLHVDCGETALAECMAVVAPLADKVAATEPVVPPMMRMRPEGPGHDHDGPRGPGGKGPKGEGPKDAPPPPPAD